MDHLIKRDGRHTDDILRFAMKGKETVWPVTVIGEDENSANHLKTTVNFAFDNPDDSILLLSLDPKGADRHAQEIARLALIERRIGVIDLPEQVSIWVYAEEGMYPELFTDSEITSKVSVLERGTQMVKTRFADTIGYVQVQG